MIRTVLHDYAPRGACLDAFHRRDPELLLSGPAGTGKSRALLEKLNAMMLASDGARGLIVRKTATSLGSTALVTWREHVIPEALDAGLITYYGGSAQEAAQYRYQNGSSVTLGGLDKATRIMSSEYDVIYVQEAIELTEADWEALTTRLRNGVISFQQLIADTNPDAQHHWLKQRCDRGQTVLLESRHDDNPTVTREYLARLDRLTGVRYQRLRLGNWVASEGIVYEDWDPTVHVVDVRAEDVPKEWRRWMAVDFGFTNPACVQWWAEDPDGRLLLYREIYRTRTLVEDLAREIQRLQAGDPKPRAVICDHDAEGRATLERYLRVSTTAAKKDVTVGVQAVQARFRVQDDGRPRLTISRYAPTSVDADLREARLPTSTLEEIPGYVWATSRTGIKEVPEKDCDHGCDAMRYVVAELDLRSRGRIRFL